MMAYDILVFKPSSPTYEEDSAIYRLSTRAPDEWFKSSGIESLSQRVLRLLLTSPFSDPYDSEGIGVGIPALLRETDIDKLNLMINTAVQLIYESIAEEQERLQLSDDEKIETLKLTRVGIEEETNNLCICLELQNIAGDTHSFVIGLREGSESG